MSLKQLNIGLLGCGTVGTGVVRALRHNGDLLAARVGVAMRIARIGVRSTGKKRAVRVPGLLTRDMESIIRDPDVDVIVELMGGTTDARKLVLSALRHGKPVVTANKALLAEHGEEIFETAAKFNTNVFYEGSVAGGIPIIKALREGLVGNRIQRIHGIVNGTCNYILSRMTQEGADFAPVLADAQRLGYAEAEPSLDIDGLDAAHKIAILASLAHGFWVPLRKVYVEGIRNITALDIEFAGKLGYVVKLLGIVKSDGSPEVEVRVHPTLVPKSHVLASINGVFNAIEVRGDVVGDTMYYGRGAGSDATASAVISDLADCARDLKFKAHRRVPPFAAHQPGGRVRPMDDVVSQFYLRMTVVDKPGVLARIASVLGRKNIGIMSVVQPEGHEGEAVPLVLTIHDATDRAMREALAEIDRLPVVKSKTVMIRVENFS